MAWVVAMPNEGLSVIAHCCAVDGINVDAMTEQELLPADLGKPEALVKLNSADVSLVDSEPERSSAEAPSLAVHRQHEFGTVALTSTSKKSLPR